MSTCTAPYHVALLVLLLGHDQLALQHRTGFTVFRHRESGAREPAVGRVREGAPLRHVLECLEAEDGGIVRRADVLHVGQVLGGFLGPSPPHGIMARAELLCLLVLPIVVALANTQRRRAFL